MSTIHLHQTTNLTPEQYIAGLTDFGPGRAEMAGFLEFCPVLTQHLNIELTSFMI